MKKTVFILALTGFIGLAANKISAETIINTTTAVYPSTPTNSIHEKDAYAENIKNTAIKPDSIENTNPRHAETRKEIEYDAWIPQILDSKTFAIEIDRLFLPMGIINLRHTWLMLVKDGHVEAGLPYWGRYSAPNLSIDHPLVVEVDAMATDYKVDTTRKGYEVNFKLYQVGETLEVELRINKDGYVSFYLYSSMRSDIRYSGAIKMVPDKSIPFRQMSDQLW